MKMIDELAENMEDQVELVPGTGEATIKHKFINCMYGGKERLAAVSAKVEEYLEQSIMKKQAGLGGKNKRHGQREISGGLQVFSGAEVLSP